MKRAIAVISLFVCLAMVGGLLSVMVATEAQAGPNVNACLGDICVTGNRPVTMLACVKWQCGDLYTVYSCDGVCSDGSGICGCEWAGCWEGWGC